jgi:hypothetical protein
MSETPAIYAIRQLPTAENFSDTLSHGKPLGVAAYRTRNEMPETWQKALPDLEDMKRVLSETQNDKEDKV